MLRHLLQTLNCGFHNKCLCDIHLMTCKEMKYLGHFLTDDLNDDSDIYRQHCKLYTQANMLLHKFSMCSVNVNCSLFRAFCTPLCTAHLWCCYGESGMRRLIEAYTDAMRLVLQDPRWHRASQLCVFSGVSLDESENSIMAGLTSPRKNCSQYSSRLRKHWQDNLHMNCFF